MQDMAQTSHGRELLQKVQEFLEKAWELIAKDVFKIKDFKNAGNIADKALYDMVNGTDLGKVKSGVGFEKSLNHEYAERGAIHIEPSKKGTFSAEADASTEKVEENTSSTSRTIH